MSCSQDYPEYGTECNVTCEEGYRNVGGKKTICMEDQNWSIVDVYCEGFFLSNKLNFGIKCTFRFLDYFGHVFLHIINQFF